MSNLSRDKAFSIALLLGCALASSACGPADRNVVRIQASSSVLFNTYVDPGPASNSTMRIATELGNATSRCADGLTVGYQRDAYNQSAFSELHLYGVEPASQAGTSFSPVQFEQLVTAPNPSVIPNVVVVPFPPTNADPTLMVSVPLAASMFWGSGGPALGSGGCYPASSPTTWLQTGGLRGFAVFQRGFCAQAKPMPGILQMVTTGVFQRFSSSVQNPKQHYTHAMSFVVRPGVLDPQDPRFNANDPNDVRGGFLLSLEYEGDYASTTNTVGASYQYFFGLRGGVVVVDTFVQKSLSESGVWGPSFAGSMKTALERDLPNQFFLVAQSLQMNALPGANPACSDASDCTVPAAFLASKISVTSLAAAGVSSPTPSDAARLQCAAGFDPACQQLGLASQFADRWVCPPVAPRTCQYVVPVKRLNAMEDLLEVVFFDGPETDNGAFALLVAGGKDAQGQLCTAQPTLTPPQTFTRTFTLVGTGP